MLKKINRDRGSVTIEATIALSTFMFAIVTVLTIVNICIVQAKVSNAINMTAKELSQYSYLYSLTGFNESQANIAQSGENQTQDINKILEDVNTVYNEIENLAQSDKKSDVSIESVQSQWQSVETAYAAGGSIADSVESIASDPKSVIFGVVKLAGSDAMDMAKSKLIAEPLARVLCKKHLVNSKDGNVDAYLKFLGVVPTGTGSYYDALDFSNSMLFPKGSNQITINVVYDVKVIPLLPLDFSFTFNQTAVTHGWLSGSDSYRSNSVITENKTTWTELSVTERASLIRHEEIDKLLEEGYYKTKGLTDVQMYNEETNEFVMISSMNPLYSGDGEQTKSLDDIDEEAIQKSVELLCGKIKSTTVNVDNVTVQKGDKKENVTCSGASNKVIIVVPEDEGLKDKIQSIVDKANKNGVVVEVKVGYGNGASTTTTKTNDAQEVTE